MNAQNDPEIDPLLAKLPTWKRQARPHTSMVNELANRGHFVTILCKVVKAYRKKYVAELGDGKMNLYMAPNLNLVLKVNQFYQLQGKIVLKIKTP
mgnify:CR=1 FL=1